MKKIFSSMLFVIALLLVGCSYDAAYYLERIEKEDKVEYLSNADILFFYKNISGFDSGGVLYFVLEFEEKPMEFLSQFENKKDESDNFIGNGKNESFEEKVNTLIHNHFKEDYLQFEEKFRLNWELPYIYINNTPDYVTLPMIYFEDSLCLIIIKLIM